MRVSAVQTWVALLMRYINDVKDMTSCSKHSYVYVNPTTSDPVSI